MAVARSKTWIDEVLTSSDLNAEFDNILNNGQTIGFPRTQSADFDGQELILDADADTSVTADTDDVVDFRCGATDVMRLATVAPSASSATHATTTLLAELSGIATSKTNLLLNGDFRVAQRGTTFISTGTHQNDDDKYIFDRWNLVSDGDDAFDITQETTRSNLPDGSYAAAKFESETANKQCGIVQFLEGVDSGLIIGGTASLSFKAITESGPEITNIRAAIISSNATEDAVTSDVVGTWAAKPTLITSPHNWVYEGTSADTNLTLTTSWQTFTIEDVPIDTSSTTNVAAFIWCADTTITAGDVFKITDVQLNLGGVSAFERRPFAQELQSCKRYFQRFLYDNSAEELVCMAYALSNTAVRGSLYYVEKRVVPTMTSSAADTFDVTDEGQTIVATIVTSDSIGVETMRLLVATDGTLVPGEGLQVHRDASDVTFIDIDAEL